MKRATHHIQRGMLFACGSLIMLLLVGASGAHHAQTTRPQRPPAPKTTPEQPIPPASPAAENGAAVARSTPPTSRKRREQAYAKLLEGQRLYIEARRRGFTAESLRLTQLALRQAVELDPSLAEAHTVLAEIAFFHLKDDLQQAEREAVTAIGIDADNFGAHRILSRIYAIKSGLFENNLDQTYAEKAIKELREVARLDPRDAEAWALLGEFYLALGRESEAITAFTRWTAAPATIEERFFQVLTKGRELTPNAATARLGEILLQAGRTAEAVDVIRRALANDPENIAYKELLGRAFEANARYDDAVALYEELLKAHGIDGKPLTSEKDKRFATRALLQIINLRQRAGQADAALAAVERMRRLLGGNDPTVDFHHILILREQKKFREALESARTAHAKYANQVEFVRLEAATLADLGRVDEAVSLLQSQLKNGAGDFNVYLALASLYIDAGRAPQAVEAARKALEIASPDRQERVRQALLILSSAQERAGDAKGSEESLRRILASEPNNPTALNNLGYFLVERNERVAEALEMIKRAVRAEPTNPSFLDSLGWAYFKLDRLEEAERYLTDAARRNPTSVAIQEHLGDLYRRRGKLDLARSAWRKALSLSSEATDTARLKAKINADNNK